uniref:Uncharacterized protein n=1 Tax=Arundo donax TaxID=35708 RepID=A0A0A9FVW1_ARUDO
MSRSSKRNKSEASFRQHNHGTRKLLSSARILE